MNEKEINEIQNKILDLSPSKLGTDFKYCCSEICRLIIKWFSNYDMSYKYYILKGANVMGGKMAHDILIVKKGNEVAIIDPTIWQFFPDAKTILVYTSNSLQEGINYANKKYNCNFVLGGPEQVPDQDIEKEYLDIIKSIIRENIKD